MASILVIGPDTALLEGVSQTLVGAGHRVVVASDVAEALTLLGSARPLVALVDCAELNKGGSAFHIPLAQGGALLAFHCDDNEPVDLPFSVKRMTLAELSLPLERQRLLALVGHVESRARATGRDTTGGDDAELRE